MASYAIGKKSTFSYPLLLTGATNWMAPRVAEASAGGTHASTKQGITACTTHKLSAGYQTVLRASPPTLDNVVLAADDDVDM